MCNGLEQVDWSDLPLVASSYGEAWNERDDRRRLHLLSMSMVPSASYVDSFMAAPVFGREAIADEIGGFHDGWGAVYFEPLPWSSTDVNHERMRMRWRLCDSSGAILLIGADIGTLGPMGHMTAIHGFSNEPAEFMVEDGCTGQSNTDWSRVPDLVRGYGDSWHATEDATRLAILHEIWAEDAYYVDPFVDSPRIGRQQMNEHMAFAMGAGHYVEVTSWTANNMHHDRIWIPWRHCCPTGATLLEGDDVFELDPDGRVRRATSWWNSEVELPADVACD